VFWPVTAYTGFQGTRDLSRDCQRDHQTGDERAHFESAENQSANSNCEKERHPNLGIAQPRHEQVESRSRPLLVNQVKNGLVHARWSVGLSFTPYAFNKQTR
jgi:hypothetical protein